MISSVSKWMVRMASAVALVGCAPDGSEGADGLGIEQPPALEGLADDEELGSAEQGLGSFSQLLPLRGTDEGAIAAQFQGSGMMHAMTLRSGALVDAVTTHFYTPSNVDNRYRPGDALFTRGPFGGTAGSEQPILQCPAGHAAHGLYGRSGKRVDMLGLVCAQIGADGRPLTSSVKVVGAYGGNGGMFFYDTCGEGSWLSGATFGSALKTSGSNKIISYVRGHCSSAR
jgi:hypothetical protein